MALPAFRHGDLVKVVHAFDHEHWESPAADALLSGDLYAYVCDISLPSDGDSLPAYMIAWHGSGQTARDFGGGRGGIATSPHKAGYTSAWWSECCLALVAGRPNP